MRRDPVALALIEPNCVFSTPPAAWHAPQYGDTLALDSIWLIYSIAAIFTIDQVPRSGIRDQGLRDCR